MVYFANTDGHDQAPAYGLPPEVVLVKRRLDDAQADGRCELCPLELCVWEPRA